MSAADHVQNIQCSLCVKRDFHLLHFSVIRIFTLKWNISAGVTTPRSLCSSAASLFLRMIPTWKISGWLKRGRVIILKDVKCVTTSV